jgi:tyrosyl-tRNA synthetase
MGGTLLRWLTLVDREAIEALEAEGAAHPERRTGQRAFAFDLTARVHGHDEAERQVRVAEAAFGTGPLADPVVLGELHAELGGFEVRAEVVRAGALAIALASGLYASAGEARRAIAQGGLSLTEGRVTATDEAVTPIAGEWLVVRAGKKRLAVGRVRR